MTTSITIKDSTATDRVFTVRRQPSGSASAVLVHELTGAGQNRTMYPKIELSSQVVSGRSQPVATVTVPYGALVDGAWVKQGQVSTVISAKQPDAAPDLVRLNAEAYARNLLANPQVMSLFQDGLI